MTPPRHAVAADPVSPRATGPVYPAPMPLCKACDDEVDELFTVRVDGRKRRLCEDCVDRAREEAEIAEASEAVIQDMMGFKGRR